MLSALARREVGIRWKPSYPHLRPRWGQPRDLPRRWREHFDNDGFILGSTSFSLREFDCPDEVDYLESLPTSGACYRCEEAGRLWCQQCLLLLCVACWEQSFRGEDCCGALFCIGDPDLPCRAGHSVCADHRDACLVCAGHLCAEHSPNHTYIVVGSNCACGSLETRVCLACGAARCSQCSCCEEPRWLLVDHSLSEAQLEGWQPLAQCRLAPPPRGVEQLGASDRHLAEHLQMCWEFFDAALAGLLAELEPDDSSEDLELEPDELDQLLWEANQPLPDSAADETAAHGQLQEPVLLDLDSDSEYEQFTFGPGTFAIETETASGSLCSLIDSEQTRNFLLQLLQRYAISHAVLLLRDNRVRLLCRWWEADVWSAHHLASGPDELLELLEEAARADLFFPAWFVQRKHPALAPLRPKILS